MFNHKTILLCQIVLLTVPVLGQVKEGTMKGSIHRDDTDRRTQNWGFTAPGDQGAGDSAFYRLPGTGLTPDYELGPGDRITIQVVGIDELEQTLKISQAGRINLPYLGVVDAGGLTAGQLEEEVAKGLVEAGLVKNPEVLVFVEDYWSKPIYLLGEVDNPGEYMMAQPLTLQDAIFVAGGLDMTAAREGFLHRRISGAHLAEEPEEADKEVKNPQPQAQEVEIIRINLQPAKHGGIVEPNLKLRAGDTLFVPEKRVKFVYIAGEIIRSGAYEMPEEREWTVKEAIAAAGGTTKTAKSDAGILVRYAQDGKREELAVNFEAILKGEDSDFPLQPNDVIFVPGSHAKEIGVGLLAMVPRIAAGFIFPF